MLWSREAERQCRLSPGLVRESMVLEDQCIETDLIVISNYLHGLYVRHFKLLSDVHKV